MSDRSVKFARLMSAMGKPFESANPGIDDKQLKRLEFEQQLAQIDSKIEELEQSNDPNALESLNFWKQRRAQLAGD